MRAVARRTSSTSLSHRIEISHHELLAGEPWTGGVSFAERIERIHPG
jgi:hypothetical protein